MSMPDSASIATIIAALLVFVLAEALAGQLIRGQRWAELDTLAGLGVVVAMLTVAAALGLRLSLAATVLGSVAGGSLLFRCARERTLAVRWLPVLVPLAPLLLIAAAAPATHWDDFMHWLLNAAYLWRFDSPPRADLPPSPSTWAAYPYGRPFLVWLVSRIVGSFRESAGGVVNLLLLALFARVLASLILVPGTPAAASRQASLWPGSALGAALLTLFGPLFNPHWLFSALSDIATSVALAAVTLATWLATECFREGRRAEAQGLAWQAALIAAFAVSLRQSNLVPVALAWVALLLLTARAPQIPIRALLGLAARLTALPATLWLLWRWYAGHNMAGKEMALRPLSQWSFDVAGAMAAAMGDVASSHPVLFGGLLIMMLAGAWVFVRGAESPESRLLGVFAVVGWGYLGLLVIAYLGAMTSGEAANANEFWRYSTHLGALGLAVAAVLLGPWLRARAALVNRAGFACMVLLPIATLLQAEQLAPGSDPVLAAMRREARDMADSLPEGSVLMVTNRSRLIDDRYPTDILPYILRYELWRPGREDRELALAAEPYLLGEPSENERLLAKATAERRVTHLFIDEPPEEWSVDAWFGPQRADRSLLLERDPSGGWRPLRSWPGWWRDGSLGPLNVRAGE
jgi:hypothetical protein